MEMPTLYITPLENITETEPKLIEIINRGYDKPRFRYGVILTPRIKDSIMTDFPVEDPQKVYMGICLASAEVPSNSTMSVSAEDDGSATTKKLMDRYKELNGDVVISEEYEPILEAYRDGSLTSRTLGTVCLKPYSGNDEEKDYEVTGFTSFYPGLSRQILTLLEEFAKDKLDVKNVWLDVIEEHELVPYYEKAGYKYLRSEKIGVDPETHDLTDNHTMEDSIKASQDFHIAVMKKTIE